MIRVKPLTPISSSQLENENVCDDKIQPSAVYDSIILMLKFCGSFYGGNVKKRCKSTVHLIYCFILLLFVFVLCARYSLVFRPGNTPFNKIGLLAYMYYYFSGICIAFVYFYFNSRYLPLFLTTIDNFNNKFGVCFNIAQKRIFVNKVVLGISSTMTLVLLVGSTTFLTFARGQKILTNSNMTPFEDDEGILYFVTAILVSLCQYIINMIIVSNMILLQVTLHVFKYEFNHIKQQIQKCSKENHFDGLERIRQQHGSLEEIVETGNKFFCHSAAMTYAYGIPIVCLTLYGATTRGLSSTDIFAMTTLMTFAVLGIFINTFSAANLNDAAHGSLRELFKIDLSNKQQYIVSQIQIFIARLTGPPIGVSVYSLFTIDHSTILMVFGTIISYAVIVVQFTTAELCAPVLNNSTGL